MTENNTQPIDAPVALQLYSLRTHSDDFADLIKVAAEAGYAAVETVFTHNISSKEMQSILDDYDMQIAAAHVPYEAAKENLDSIIEFFSPLGNPALIVPAPPEAVRRSPDQEPWRAFARTLADMGRRCREAEMRMGYHNHHWEMRAIRGRRVLDWMMSESQGEDLFLELDLAWVVRGNEDPLDLLSQFGNRCRFVHVKDIAPEGENKDQDGWTDVGSGTMDWATLLPAAKRAGVEWFVAEHDKPADAVTWASNSLAFLREHAELMR